jgi:hypothetical protein
MYRYGMAIIVVSSLLALLLALSAALKLSGKRDVVASYERLGVPPQRLPLLAGVLLLAVAGLLAGFVVPLLGLVTAACVTLYFAVAIGVHVRTRNLRNIAAPIAIAALAVANTVLDILAIVP